MNIGIYINANYTDLVDVRFDCKQLQSHPDISNILSNILYIFSFIFLHSLFVKMRLKITIK